MTTEKPRYSRKPLGSVRALALVTGTSPGYLYKLARSAPRMYHVVYREGEPGKGKLPKVTYNPEPPLKTFQQKLIATLLSAVEFPSYINGGVRSRSYRDDCALHVCAENVLGLDIATFYESVSSHGVKRLWQQFFNFAPEVAELLTALTTHSGHLPRGAPTSNYLANLLFWREEPNLHDQLAQRGIRYSRYVDDVSLTARRHLDNEEIQHAIAQVYGMFKSKGIKPNRKKQRISRRGHALRVHNVNVGGAEPSLPKSTRDEIRAGLHNLEGAICQQGLSEELQGRINHLGGKVGWLKHFDPERGTKAHQKLTAILTSAEVASS